MRLIHNIPVRQLLQKLIIRHAHSAQEYYDSTLECVNNLTIFIIITIVIIQLTNQHYYRPIIFTDRGKGGMSMKTAKFFSAGYNDGLAALLDTVIENNPNSNVSCYYFN